MRMHDDGLRGGAPAVLNDYLSVRLEIQAVFPGEDVEFIRDVMAVDAQKRRLRGTVPVLRLQNGCHSPVQITRLTVVATGQIDFAV